MDDITKYTNSQLIEEVTGESPDKVRRWKRGITKVPESAIRLLKLYVEGDVSALLGKDWQGFYFRKNLLFVPEWRNGFTAHHIRSMFFRCQQVAALESEIRMLKQQLEERISEYEALEIKADFYRRQLILESRFGMMLQRSFL